MDDQLLGLFHRHAGPAFDRRLRLADLVAKKAGGADAHYDLAAAALAFGPKVVFEAPVVGAVAPNGSWVWAWSDHRAKLTLTNRALGTAVRALAAKDGVPAFAQPAFPVEPILGADLAAHAADVFGVVLAGELGYDTSFVVPPGGAVVLVRDARLRPAEKHPLARVRVVFPQMMRELPVPDPRAALANYARSYALAVADGPGGLTVTGDGGELTATFDARGRLATFDGTATVPKPAAKTRGKK